MTRHILLYFSFCKVTEENCCPDGWVAWGKSCYLLSNGIEVNYTDAEACFLLHNVVYEPHSETICFRGFGPGQPQTGSCNRCGSVAGLCLLLFLFFCMSRLSYGAARTNYDF